MVEPVQHAVAGAEIIPAMVGGSFADALSAIFGESESAESNIDTSANSPKQKVPSKESQEDDGSETPIGDGEPVVVPVPIVATVPIQLEQAIQCAHEEENFIPSVNPEGSFDSKQPDSAAAVENLPDTRNAIVPEPKSTTEDGEAVAIPESPVQRDDAKATSIPPEEPPQEDMTAIVVAEDVLPELLKQVVAGPHERSSAGGAHPANGKIPSSSTPRTEVSDGTVEVSPVDRQSKSISPAIRRVQVPTREINVGDEGIKAPLRGPQPETPREPAPDGLSAGTKPHKDQRELKPQDTTPQLQPSAETDQKAPDIQVPVVRQQKVAALDPSANPNVTPSPDVVVCSRVEHDITRGAGQQSRAQEVFTREAVPPLSGELRPEPGAIHLVSRLEHQELRFGWNSQEFGRIEVRTTIEHDRVGAVISAPDAQLRASLHDQMGLLDKALAGHSLELSQFSTFDNSASQDASRNPQFQQSATSSLLKQRKEVETQELIAGNHIHAHAGLLDLRA